MFGILLFLESSEKTVTIWNVIFVKKIEKLLFTLSTLNDNTNAWLTLLQNKIEGVYSSEEPLSFYQKRQLDFEKECRLLGIETNSPEAQQLRKSAANTNIYGTAAAYTNNTNIDDEVWLIAQCNDVPC